MSRNIENHFQPLGTATGPSFLTRKMPLVPVLIVCTATLVALFAWTIPNWMLFAQNVASFSTLWQIAANRQVIIILVIKVGSPILVGLLLVACNRLWYLVKPFLQEEPQEHTRASHQVLATPQHSSGQKKTFPQINPETPLPPIMDQVPSMERNPQNNEQGLWGNDSASHRGELSPRAAALQQRRYQRYHGENEDLEIRVEAEKNGASIQPTQEASVVATVEAVEEQGTANTRLGEVKPYEISITLLKKVSMTLMTAQGVKREVPLSLNAKRVQLLAYLACLRGQPVNRDRMLEQLFGHGKDDEEATREKLGEAFDSHKKLIRWDLREVINKLNTQAGSELIPSDLDIFAHKQRLYWLSEVCYVTDLEEIEKHHKVIELARKDGLLVDEVPNYVKDACDQLMTAYTGDFLEELVTDYLDDFEPWTSSWARKPYTLFRDYHLQALWYAAEYELRQGQQFSDERLDMESERKEQRKHWDQAAQHYRTYAMTACNSRFDTKVTFGNGAGREHGERVIMSERALRRSLVLYGSIGATHQVDQVYSAYYKQMRSISAKAWEPSKTTLTDLRSAKEQTNAYRFPTQVTPHEPFPSMDNHLETSA